jgi:citrate lyase subunit beta/citryl-CoA lyase
MRWGIRSLLFVPGDDERKLARAADTEADALILDLEDAVSPEHKEQAREFVAQQVGAGLLESEIIVRINGAGTPWFEDDLAALTGAPVAIMLPKATASMMVRVPEAFDLVGLIETASGVEEAVSVAAGAQTRRLMLGSADLAAELGIALTADESELHYPRARIAMGSAAAGIEPPIDVVHLDVRDPVGLRDSALRAKRLGFTGKACIHPRQVAVVNDAFTPTAAEVDRATEVVEAFDRAQSQGSGVTVLDGRLIDLPVVLRARRILQGVAIAPACPATAQTSDNRGA